MRGYLLLLVMALFLMSGVVGAQEVTSVVAIAEVNAERVVQYEPFVVTVFVDHPLESEVAVSVPQAMNAAFSIEQVRTESRFLKQGGTENDPAYRGERWTAVEMVLAPLLSGNVTVGPFQAEVKGVGTVFTEVKRIYVRPAPARSRPELFWAENVGKPSKLAKVASVKVGETVVMTLRVRGMVFGAQDASGVMPAPQAALVSYPPPEEALVENEVLSAEELASGVLCRVRLTPLRVPAGGVLHLAPEPASVKLYNQQLTAPELELRVTE